MSKLQGARESHENLECGDGDASAGRHHHHHHHHHDYHGPSSSWIIMNHNGSLLMIIVNSHQGSSWIMIMRIIILPIRILLEIPKHLLIVAPLNMYAMLCHFHSKTQMPSAIYTAVLRPCIKTNSESLTTTLLLAAISTSDFSVQRSVSWDVFHFRSFQDSSR